MTNKSEKQSKIAIIEESTNYNLIEKLGIDQGLEPEELGDVKKAWTAKVEDKVVGGIIFQIISGEFMFGSLSILPEYRNKNIATNLVQKAIEAAKNENDCNRILIQAKVADFFSKFGFKEIDPRTVPDHFSCLDCPKYQKDCFPKTMELIF